MTRPDVVVPTSVEELARVLRERPDAVPVGGGTLEVPRWADPTSRPATAVLLSRVDGLSAAGALGCGAAATLHTLATGPGTPDPLRAAARSVGGPAVRSLATVGGNVAQAAPG
ncbi:MAG TPA: FAD binding domain-containing protein, partial [Streptomyces sp.]